MAPTGKPVAHAEQIVRDRDPLAIKELAVTGKDVMDVLGVAPGPGVGRILSALLERVLVDPALNTKSTLLELAQTLAT